MAAVTVQMPDGYTIRERLLAISRDADLMKRFYPMLIKRLQNQRRTAFGVTLVFNDAIYSYTRGASDTQYARLMKHLPDFVERLVEDAEFATEVLKEISCDAPEVS